MPQWQKFMQEEYNAVQTQGTWVLVPPPTDRSIVGCKWVYEVKKKIMMVVLQGIRTACCSGFYSRTWC